MSWTFAWLRTWDDIWQPGHLARWTSVAEDSTAHATPFMHPSLARAWLRTMGGEAKFLPFFLTARHASGQEVLWLLLRPRERHVRVLAPVGAGAALVRSGTLFDYHEPLVTPAGPGIVAGGFWTALERELRRHGSNWFDTCVLSRLRVQIFTDLPPGALAGVAPFVRLEPYADIDAFVAGRRASVRQVIRRRMRRIAAAGAVRFRMHEASEIGAVLDWLPAFEAAHRARYPTTSLSLDYLRNLVVECLPSGILRCSSLSLDGETIGWSLGFYLNAVYHGYGHSFDLRLAHLSPGTIHLAHIMDWVITHEGRMLDLLVGDEDYKSDWTDCDAFTLRTLVIENSAPAAVARRAAFRGLRRLRRLNARLLRG